jgi:KaiC/GvpD/RAD55 family RecA-like ATPase
MIPQDFKQILAPLKNRFFNGARETVISIISLIVEQLTVVSSIGEPDLKTKTELLNQLATDQLVEIAVAEKISVAEHMEKKELIRCLLVLPMHKISQHVEEYLDQEKPKRKGILEPILETASSIVGEDLGELIRDSMTRALRNESGGGEHGQDDFGELIKEKIAQSLQQEKRGGPVHPRKEKEEESKGEPSAVPTVLPDRIETGYEDLDNLLFGGIPRDYAVILEAPSCDERELLIKTFLEAGAREGQITFYVTVEASEGKALAQQFQSNFYLFVCNPQADTIIQTLPNVFKLKGVENLTDINIALTSAFRKLDTSLRAPRRACIEIISDILLQHHAVPIRRWLTALIPELKSRGFTTLAVMNPYMHPSQEVQAIQDIFDGEISIYEKETQRGPNKLLRIKKMLNQRYLDNELIIKKERIGQKTDREKLRL